MLFYFFFLSNQTPGKKLSNFYKKTSASFGRNIKAMGISHVKIRVCLVILYFVCKKKKFRSKFKIWTRPSQRKFFEKSLKRMKVNKKKKKIIFPTINPELHQPFFQILMDWIIKKTARHILVPLFMHLAAEFLQKSDRNDSEKNWNSPF